ncbi:MAG: chorismate mutase [Clostridia bacterium]|nr:chorismate mutase [Clostridia bacterium]
MNKTDLYRSIIESCDEALREAFIRRMEAAAPIAQSKIESGSEVYVPENDKRSIERVCRGVQNELRPQMLFLWRSLVRMNRGRQYAYFLENIPDYKLSYEKYLSEKLPDGAVYCAAETADAVKKLYCRETVTEKDALSALLCGKASIAAVETQSYYDAPSLYTRMLSKNVFVNDFAVKDGGGLLALLSDRLTDVGDNSVITVALATRMDVAGYLAQQMSVLAESGLNIESLALKTENIEEDEKNNVNVFFAELSGGSLYSDRVRTAFLQLEKECPYFKVLGCRKKI